VTTSVVYADASDGYASSAGTSYASCRAMTSPTVTTNLTSDFIGQTKVSIFFTVYELFQSFDTGTPIPDTDTVSSATLAEYVVAGSDYSTTDFVTDARIHDWGATLTAADVVAGADLSGKTLVATFDSSTLTTNVYNSFTSDAAFVSNVSKTGITYLILSSAEQAANSAPANAEYYRPSSADETGTSQDPKLTVVHAGAGGSNIPAISHSYRQRRI